jgi:actin-related protein 8
MLWMLLVNKRFFMLSNDQSVSEFLKRDDQILALRLQQEERLDQRKKAAVDRDRARAQDGQEGPYPEAEPDVDEDVPMDDAGNENFGSKTIIIHVGSQNLRIGFATDALPKTVPMVVARKAARSEAEDSEPCPKRLKLDDDTPSEEWFGEEVCFSVMRTSNITDHCPSSPKNTLVWQQSSRYTGGRIGAVSFRIPENW